MGDRPASLQDIVRRRQQAAFVGREGQLVLFRENLELPFDDDLKRFIFNIHGDGGVGKTHLVRQLERIAWDCGTQCAYIDETVHDVPEAMLRIAEQLGRPMRDFQERYAEYLKSHDQLTRDPQAPQGWSRATRTAVRIGLHASRIVPGVGPLVDGIDAQAAADTADQLRAYLARKFSDSADIRLLLDPIGELTPEFVRGLAKAAERQPLALFIDTYERTGPMLDGWLLDMLAGRYGELPLSMVVTIAGREPLDASQWSDYLAVIAPIPLTPFTETEARQLLSAKGITDETVVTTILALSGRLPLLLAMLAEGRPQDLAAVGDPSGTAVERFLKWEPDQSRRRVALMGALPRSIDADVLSALMGGDDVSDVFQWLCRQPFIAFRADRFEYHEVVRNSMIRLQRSQSSQAWRETHRRLQAANQAWRRDVDAADNWSHPQWLRYRMEETYHALCASTAGHRADALSLAVVAGRAGLSAARQWADVLFSAGRDAPSDELEALGRHLLTTVDDQKQDCRSFLTGLLAADGLPDPARVEALIERGRLLYYGGQDADAITDLSAALRLDPLQSRAYVWRGAAQAWLGVYEEALADFTRAIELKPDDLEAISRRGETYRLMGRYEEALADLTRAIELKADNIEAIARRGEAYRLMGLFDEALADLTRAIELKPDYAWALASRGQTYRQVGRHPEALADFGLAIELEPDYVWALASRGQTYRGLGRYAEAVADYDRAVDLEPETSWVIAERGEAYRVMGRFDDAAADLTRAIELEPDNTWALAERGEVYRSLGRYEESIADFTRAVELRPDYAWALASRGQTHRALEQYDEALADLSQAIELDSRLIWAVVERGELYRLMGRYEEAITDLNRALELYPDYMWAVAERGEAYRLLGRYEEAVSDFTRAMRLRPDYPWVIASRGQALRALGYYEESLADLDRAIELEPTLGWAVGERGKTNRVMGRYDESLADLTRALELEPGDAWAYAERGETYRLMARYEEAIEDYTLAMELRPGYAWAIASRGQAHRALGRYDEALIDLTHAIDLEPRFAWVLAERGAAYRLMGRYEDAIADFTRAIDLDPDYAWAIMNRGQTYQLMERYEEALADLSRAISLDPAAEADE